MSWVLCRENFGAGERRIYCGLLKYYQPPLGERRHPCLRVARILRAAWLSHLPGADGFKKSGLLIPPADAGD
jgi:hypothetical protein